MAGRGGTQGVSGARTGPGREGRYGNARTNMNFYYR